MKAGLEKGEVWRFTGNHWSWAGLEYLSVGDLLIAINDCHFNHMTVSVVSNMIYDGTFVKVAEADGTPVTPPLEAEGDWVEKERVRLGLDDLPSDLLKSDCLDILRINTNEADWVGVALGDGYPVHITGGQLGDGDLDKVIIALLYVRDHLKKAGYDF